MSDLIFVTSNDFKFHHASHMLEPFGIVLQKKHLDLQELQADGEAICRSKAEQAFTTFQHRLLLTMTPGQSPASMAFRAPI